MSLHASLFGAFRLVAADETEIVVGGKRAQALLAILCVQPGTAVDREQCCQLLWPGKFTAHARASLRQTLLGLKQQLAPIDADFLHITRGRVAVNAEALHSDLGDLEQALDHGGAADASRLLLTIGGKPLLDQLELGEPFRLWLDAQRDQVDQRLQRAVEEALANCQRRQDDAAARQLRDAWHLHGSTAALSGADRRIRIAVLPFESTVDDHPTPLAQGLFDELIITLGRLPELLVAGRTSSVNARKLGRRLPKIARALNVSYLLEGSIQRDNDDVRVHVSLIDGHNGFELWGQSYQGSISNVLGLQDEIAGSVSRDLARALQLEPAPPGPRKTSAPSQAAMKLYLQGRALTMRAIGDGVLARAVELLESAVELEPDFAAAWTALAEAYVYTTVYTPCLDRAAKSAKMAECAMKAIELDPGQGHARAMLGIHRWTENDPTGALDLAHEAYRLEPDNPDVTLRLGSFLLYIGRTREALPYLETAIEQDPVNGRNFGMLSVARLNLGEIDEAIQAGQRMVDLGLPSMWLGVATAAAGHHELAVEQYRQTRFLMNTVIFPPAGTQPLTGTALNAFWKIAAKGVCSGRKIHRAVYCRMLDYLHGSLPDPCDTSIVAPAIWMGYSKMIFKTLGKQITPANMFCLMSLWADIEPIRQTRLHPEFLPFAERIGLMAAWQKYGWPDLLPASGSGISRS